MIDTPLADGDVNVRLTDPERGVLERMVDEALSSPVDGLQALADGLKQNPPEGPVPRSLASGIMSAIFTSAKNVSLVDPDYTTLIGATGKILSAYTPAGITPYLRAIITH
jgi:hypothetical protein